MNSNEISFPLFGEGFVIDPPTYVTIFGLNIYLYGLFIAAGFIIAGIYLYKRHEALALTKDNVLDLILLAVPCGIVGARLYYAIFNFSDYFGPGKWLNIFMVRQGGLAVYGGVIGGGLAFYMYSRRKKMPVGKLLDAAGFGLLIGQAIGRWGNFFNREAFGTVTDLPWKMGLRVQSSLTYVHPTFLYESLWNIAGLIILHVISKKNKIKYHGQVFLYYVTWYGFGRYMIEGIRTDSLFVSGTDIRISQLLAAASFSTAVALLLRNRLRGTGNTLENAEFGIQNSELPNESNDDDKQDDDNAELFGEDSPDSLID